MIDQSPTCTSLNDEQRRWVSENLGLIGVHLRHLSRAAGRRQPPEEYQELFQEGCLGLIQAALRYQPERNIPFAAFALARIRHAISLALTRGDPRSRDRLGPVSKTRPERDASAVEGVEVADVSMWRLGGRADRHVSRRHPYHAPKCSIRKRLGGKYARAIGRARRVLLRRSTARGDRPELLDTLIRERWLIPAEESRMALREIARRTRSSFARVVQCDHRLADTVRHLLSADPEFNRLVQWAKTDPRGIEAGLTPALRGELAEIGAAAFLARFKAMPAAERATWLCRLLAQSDAPWEPWVFEAFRGLRPRIRERFFHATLFTGAGLGGEWGRSK